ncbi:MAG: GNAT family N-acetyltransferase [Gammaproteobacteria bacterium]|nr:GNAT family N-acetyltransferase [Gammaproteobacteria bacterium]
MRLIIETQLSGIAAQEWSVLLDKSAANTIFQTHEWHDSFLGSFGAKYEEVYFLCVREDNDLVCIAPLMITVVRNNKRVLQFIGHGLSDFTSFIYDRTRPDALQFLLNFIKHDWKLHWDYMVLKSVPVSVEKPEDLIKSFRETGLYCLIFEKCSSAGINLHDLNFVSQIHGKRKLKQQLNRLARMGKYEVLHLTSYEEIEPYLNSFFKQHIDQWAITNTPSFFLDEENSAFYRSFLAAMAKKKWVNFTAIVLNGTPIAFGIGFLYANTFLFYKTSYDVAYLKRSPGSVLLLELINFATRCGFHEFNFGAGFEGYKTRFSNVAFETCSYKIFGGRLGFIIDSFMLKLVDRVKEVQGGEKILDIAKRISGYRSP